MFFRGALAFLFLATSLHAHSGTETETTVSLFKERVTVVIRCAPELAWRFLGPDAPRGPLTRSFATAKPRLEKLAPTLLRIDGSDGKALEPTRLRADLEPDDHVALTLTYPRPAGAMTLHAAFLKRFDALDPTTVRFFDRTTGKRAADPFATRQLESSRQSLRFSPGQARLIEP